MQYFQRLADMIKSRPAASFQPYLQWNVLMLLIGHLTEDMVKAKLGINKDLYFLVFGESLLNGEWSENPIDATAAE